MGGLKNKVIFKYFNFFGIQTWILKVEGKHADHKSTTKAQDFFVFRRTDHISYDGVMGHQDLTVSYYLDAMNMYR